MSDTQYRLSDDVISQIAKVLQLAILSGTDVVDHLRMIRLSLTSDDVTLTLSDQYRAISEDNIGKMQAHAEEMAGSE
jgi:hypothetical protein